jgi:hypothetical protein
MGNDLISDYSWISETTPPSVPAPYRSTPADMAAIAMLVDEHMRDVRHKRPLTRVERIVARIMKASHDTCGAELSLLIMAHVVGTAIVHTVLA